MYIHDSICISPQDSYQKDGLASQPLCFTEENYFAVEPDYMEFIPLAQLRRMGKVVRMGIGAGLPLVAKHKLDGIIIGTAHGGHEDCIDFLNQIVDYDEGTLTPTKFVQSTPNAVAGSLGFMSENRGYNATHVNGANSFESALIDTQMLLSENEKNAYLVGGLDELTPFAINQHKLSNFYKTKSEPSQTLLDSTTAGTSAGEGAAMFVVSNEPIGASSKLLDIETWNFGNEGVAERMIQEVLSSNGLQVDDVDALLLGLNGDAESADDYSKVEGLFPDTKAIYSFKNLVGEYQTSSAFALWYANGLIRCSGQNFPQPIKGTADKIDRLMIYNHFKGEQHSLMLLEKV